MKCSFEESYARRWNHFSMGLIWCGHGETFFCKHATCNYYVYTQPLHLNCIPLPDIKYWHCRIKIQILSPTGDIRFSHSYWTNKIKRFFIWMLISAVINEDRVGLLQLTIGNISFTFKNPQVIQIKLLAYFDVGPQLTQHYYALRPAPMAHLVSEVLVGCLSSRLFIYSVPNCLPVWSVQCCLWYWRLWYWRLTVWSVQCCLPVWSVQCCLWYWRFPVNTTHWPNCGWV